MGGLVDSEEKDTLLQELPQVAREIMLEQQLEPLQIWRNGPRYVAAEVVSPYGKALFKLVLPDIRGASITANKTVREMDFLSFLRIQAGFEDSAPHIFASSQDKPVWMLRSLFESPTLSNNDSPFRFNDEFYSTIEPKEVVAFFQRIHAATPALSPTMHKVLDRYPATMGFYKKANHWPGIVLPQEEFEGITTEAIALFNSAKHDWDRAPRVISHCEPYGVHLFRHGDSLTLIDWENVALWNQLHDLSMIWIRAFEDPIWQNNLYRAIEDAGYFEGPHELIWKCEIVMQCAANYIYFKYHSPEAVDFREAGKTFFMQTIKAALG